MRRYNKSAKGQKILLNGIGAAFKIANRVYKEQQRENRRRERAVQSFMAKREREEAAAQRRRVREAERIARERARLQRENEKLQKKLQFEAEVQSIIEENEEWTSLHKDVSALVTDGELVAAMLKAELEKNDSSITGLFEEPAPEEMPYRSQANKEAFLKFRTDFIRNEIDSKITKLDQLQFEDVEPTEETVSLKLREEGKSSVKAFWFWTKKRLVNEYVQEHIKGRLKEEHDVWSKNKSEYESKVASVEKEIEQLGQDLQAELVKKKAFIDKRTEELYNPSYTTWKTKRDSFYDSYLDNLNGLLKGDQYVIGNALSDVLSDNDLPMDYYVECLYEASTGTVRLDVDLPEMEDIPQRKIVLTSTGKQSIRSKAAKDLNNDYVECVCGLAIFLAEDIFNISPAITHVEISGFTQRTDSKTSLVSDQYVYVIDFDRPTYSKINFKAFSAIQIFSFFHHHINLTKSMVLKEIDMSDSYDKLQQYVPVDYADYILKNPNYAQTNASKNSCSSSAHASNASNQSSSTSLSAYSKSAVLSDKIYSFICKLDTPEIEAHAESLNGVHLNFSSFTSKGSDCDITKYRGKLFFICIIDLYKSLKLMGVDVFSAEEPLLTYSLVFNKIYTKLQTDSSSIKSIFSLVQTFNSTFSSQFDSIPSVSHKLLILEILSDYKDLSYYRTYHELIKNFGELVYENAGNELSLKKSVRNFLSQFNEYIK